MGSPLKTGVKGGFGSSFRAGIPTASGDLADTYYAGLGIPLGYVILVEGTERFR